MGSGYVHTAQTELSDVDLKAGKSTTITCSHFPEQRVIQAGIGLAKAAATGFVLYSIWKNRAVFGDAAGKVLKKIDL